MILPKDEGARQMQDLLTRARTRLREAKAAERRAMARHVATPTESSAKAVHELNGMISQLEWFTDELRTVIYKQEDLSL